MPSAEAFCPAGISSFFEICSSGTAGGSIADAELMGARGGGFSISRGARARVTVRRGSKTQVRILINSKLAPEAHTTRSAVLSLLSSAGLTGDVKVEVDVHVPVGAGFGSSAAGTLASCLALAEATQIPITFNELGRLAHVAEVINGTGLGTVTGLLRAGFVLVIEPGAPGVGVVDRLFFPKGHSIICAHLASILTRDSLAERNLAARVNPAGRKTLAAIRRRPELSVFLTETEQFSRAAGFLTPAVTRIIEIMLEKGAVGATQNMIGEAVHGVAENSVSSRIVKAVKKKYRTATVFVASLDDVGLRLT